MSNVTLGEEIYVESLRAGDNPEAQGVKFDNGKTPYSLIPPEGPSAVAAILAGSHTDAQELVLFPCLTHISDELAQ